MKDKKKYLYHGLTWVILGVLLYWRRQELLQLGWGIFWPFIPFIFGLLMVVDYWRDRKKGLITAGAFLAGTGLFSLLFTTKVLSWPGVEVVWPFVLFLAGLVFFLVYINDFADPRPPVLALFFIAAGFFCLSRNQPAMAAQLRLYAQVFTATAGCYLLIVVFSQKRRSS
ncbi:MAG: hypothetical protein GX085_02515 [Firmicutes bacterium]|nr:hypothetical protein [Bacillota bacterium]